MNNPNFVTLGGNPAAWDAEDALLVPGNRGEALCRLQESQSARGYRCAELVPTMYGWGVRAGSGLQGREIMLRSRGVSRDEAIAWGVAWANADPLNREFYARKSDLALDENKPYGV